MAISKVVYKSSPSDTGTIWMDVTGKTVTSASMLNGITALKNDGTDITGSIVNMTLPTAASASSSGTQKAEITAGSSAQYINIPTGFNGTAAHYKVNASGGGSSKAIQIDNSNHRVQTTSYTDTGAYLKVAKAGKYDIYWSAFRSSTSSGTNGTQWYKNGVAQGSAYTTWTNSYCQNPHVTGVTLAKDDEISIYARASSTSRYCCVENLMIIEVD